MICDQEKIIGFMEGLPSFGTVPGGINSITGANKAYRNEITDGRVVFSHKNALRQLSLSFSWRHGYSPLKIILQVSMLIFYHKIISSETKKEHGVFTPYHLSGQMWILTLDHMQTLPLRLQSWMTELAHKRPSAGEPPLRAELFSVEQLARHAKWLAANQQVAIRQGSNNLLPRLGQNEDVLRTFNRATLGETPGRRITPAAEWLLDNFYLIEEQIHMARRHLPRGYSRELPRLASGACAGLPRVYDIVLELISHVDAQIDEEPLSAFIAAYQTVHALKLGELWAIPIMLRLGLIENLQRITTRLSIAREDRDLADFWVKRLQEMAGQDPSRLVIVVADMAKSELPLSSSFVAEFCQRLSRQSPVLHLARGWLEQRLGQQGLSIEQLVQLESQNQAADQVSVSHSITSLRFLGAMDWRQFVENLSQVELILRGDPAGVYDTMDFATRDRYRHAVEFLSRQSELSEADVAQRAIQLAADRARQAGESDRAAHVGFYLIDKGRTDLARLAKVRWPWQTTLERAIHRFPLTFYAGGIGLLTWLATLWFVRQSLALNVQGGKLIFFTVIFLVCASQPAVALMNWLSLLLVKPCLLPRLDYSSGIPEGCRTMVVVPTMLTSASGVDRLIETMEIHHLANRDQHLHFALLTDFRDAPAEVLADDEILRQRVRAGIGMLNQKYRADGPESIFPVSPSAPVESGRKPLDGLRAQAGKIDGIQRAFARWCVRPLFRDRRRYDHSAGNKICHHARQRHAVATRSGAPTRRHHGSSIEPAGV